MCSPQLPADGGVAPRIVGAFPRPTARTARPTASTCSASMGATTRPASFRRWTRERGSCVPWWMARERERSPAVPAYICSRRTGSLRAGRQCVRRWTRDPGHVRGCRSRQDASPDAAHRNDGPVRRGAVRPPRRAAEALGTASALITCLEGAATAGPPTWRTLPDYPSRGRIWSANCDAPCPRVEDFGTLTRA